MIRKFKKEDTTKVMTLWTKGNFDAHYFIEKDYWLENFNRVKNEYLFEAETYIYCTSTNEIKGFISIDKNQEITSIFVRKDSIRQGMGSKLMHYCQNKNNYLKLKVYEKNINAILFFVAMGFKNKAINLQEKTGEKIYTMEWKNNERK